MRKVLEFVLITFGRAHGNRTMFSYFDIAQVILIKDLDNLIWVLI